MKQAFKVPFKLSENERVVMSLAFRDGRVTMRSVVGEVGILQSEATNIANERRAWHRGEHAGSLYVIHLIAELNMRQKLGAKATRKN